MKMEQNKEILKAIELLNKNGYIVSKVDKAQIAIAKQCEHDKEKCNFNLIGIKCVDLLCVQKMIKEQIFPYIEEDESAADNN